MNQEVTPCRTTYTLQQTPGQVNLVQPCNRMGELASLLLQLKNLLGCMQAAA